MHLSSTDAADIDIIINVGCICAEAIFLHFWLDIVLSSKDQGASHEEQLLH